MEARIVLTTCGDTASAEQLVHSLVTSGLVACGNILPQIRSIYRWEGKVEESAESLVILKTTAAALEPLEQKLLELHSYDTPEFVVLEPERVNEKYLQWLLDSVENKGDAHLF